MNSATSRVDAPPPHIEQLLSKYAPVRLAADTSRLTPGDRAALEPLREAAGWVDRIYWRQRSEFGWDLKQRLDAEGGDERLKRLVALGFGPWDVFDNDRPFMEGAERAPGGGNYPPDLSREELDRYLQRNPELRASLLDATTQIRRDGDRLIAVPYVTVFREELRHIHDALLRAAATVSHPGFATFLRARADGLVSGELSATEAIWTGVGDSPIDIAIGPYEVYDDGLMGIKTSYEAMVLVHHPMTATLASFEELALELETILPGSVVPVNERARISIGVYDVLCAGGAANMGAKAIAAMLPNDEAIRRHHGSRLLLFRNVIAAKFAPILRPLAERVLDLGQLHLLSEDAFVIHTLLHEMAHALVPADEAGPSPARALHERYSTIEECRADVVGLMLLDHLIVRGRLPATLRSQAAATFIAGVIRSLRFGSGNDYGKASAIVLSHLVDDGAVVIVNGRLRVDVDRMWPAIRAIALRVQSIANRGAYDEAGALIDELGRIPAPMEALLGDLREVPVDVEFVVAATETPAP